MMTMYPNVQVKRVNPRAPLPTYARDGDAGMDLRTMETVTIGPHETVLVGSGIAMAIPEGYEGECRPRSGMATKHGITLANTPSTIDSNYRGEIMLPLHNLSDEPFTVHAGDRVCQILIKPVATATVIETAVLDETARGSKGFGSTGRK